MDPIDDDLVNDEPLAPEQSAPVRRRRRRAPSILEPPRRRREQIGGTARQRTELFLRENPVPLVIGALAIGLVIGLAVHFASRQEEKEAEVKTPLGRFNLGVLSLPFLWPLFRGMKEKLETSTDAVREGVGRVRSVDIDRYTKPLRKRWKSWTS
jgi:hypothetical protein